MDDGAHFWKDQHLRGTQDLRLFYSLPSLGGSRLLPSPVWRMAGWGKAGCGKGGWFCARGGWGREHRALGGANRDATVRWIPFLQTGEWGNGWEKGLNWTGSLKCRDWFPPLAEQERGNQGTRLKKSSSSEVHAPCPQLSAFGSHPRHAGSHAAVAPCRWFPCPVWVWWKLWAQLPIQCPTGNLGSGLRAELPRCRCLGPSFQFGASTSAAEQCCSNPPTASPWSLVSVSSGMMGKPSVSLTMLHSRIGRMGWRWIKGPKSQSKLDLSDYAPWRTARGIFGGRQVCK